MQCFMILAIIGAEKDTLVLNLLDVKFWQSKAREM